MWKGRWNRQRTAFSGSYTFEDGTIFTGEAVRIIDNHGPVAPHFQFTGSWEIEGMAAAPVEPPENPPEK